MQIIGGGVASHLETYIRLTATLWGLMLNLGVSLVFPVVITIFIILWVGCIWLKFIRDTKTSKDKVLFLFSVAILINLIFIPYSWMHNLALLLLPFGYSLSLVLQVKNKIRYSLLAFLLFLMHPLPILLYLAFGGAQSYQIILALILLPTMIALESKIKPEEKINVRHALSG
jgi:hypothetical protein